MPPAGQDPNLEPIPDFNGPGYQNLRNLMMQGNGVTMEQATAQLEAAHNSDRPERVISWENQVHQEQEAEDLQVEQARIEKQQRREEKLRVEEAERKELEKKNLKINDFDEHSMGESIIML
jgi:hypothetical protein